MRNTLGYLIEVTPRLFIFRKKSYLHSLIRYPTIINFEVFPQKIVIFHRKWLYFEKNPTSILLLYTPCLFHILYLSDSTLIQYPTSIWYPRVTFLTLTETKFLREINIKLCGWEGSFLYEIVCCWCIIALFLFYVKSISDLVRDMYWIFGWTENFNYLLQLHSVEMYYKTGSCSKLLVIY